MVGYGISCGKCKIITNMFSLIPIHNPINNLSKLLSSEKTRKFNAFYYDSYDFYLAITNVFEGSCSLDLTVDKMQK